MTAVSNMGDEMQPRTDAYGKSLDVVQRAVISVLVGVVLGLFAAVLALYAATSGRHDLAHSDDVGLWIMSGVLGLLTAGGILIINRRPPYHPLVLIGLLPMAAAAYWIF